MANLSELPFSTRLFLKAYPWRRNDPVPWATFRKPLREAKVALMSTAGLVLPTQEPFDNDVRGGDWTFREIPSDAGTKPLIDTHRSESYDHSGVHTDANVAFPIDRIRELAEEGVIGAVNHRHFSLMGSITAPGRLMKHSAPAIADALAADGVDAVLLVPI
ncbi:MAG TPA: glycine/sarcosine/betaine reductase selenoprotein B family protein [Thermoanaerobaculia bacterium]|jgi:D-proline reductase (dithiol) PrdB|nr:glycine/sarcosine/betaine reductase selenoprotein B family protein [Thermoanaerobaculia bacterium]